MQIKTKFIYLQILLLFIGKLSFSQASLGLKAGAGIFSIQSELKSKSMFAWEAGFFSYADLSDKINLQPEIDFSDKGGEVSFADSSYTIHLQSANMRFIVSYLFNDHFSAGAGPYFSYMFMARQNKELVPKSWYSPFGVGLNVAASAYAGDWIFSIRYDKSLTLLTRDNDVEISKSFNPLKGSHVNGFSLVVCVGFD